MTTRGREHHAAAHGLAERVVGDDPEVHWSVASARRTNRSSRLLERIWTS